MKLVLLPGLHGSAQLFEPLIEQLPDTIEIQVIAYPANERLSYQQLLILVLAQLPDQDFVLLGESFSGPLVYQVAFRNPKNLRAVIFAASFLETPRPILLNLVTRNLLGLLKILPLSPWLIKIGLLGTEASNNSLSLCKQVLDQLSPGVLVFRLAEISHLRRRHWPCYCKAVYIQALRDKIVSDHSVHIFKNVFTEMEIRTVNGAHFVLQEQPSDCASIIVETLRTIQRK